MHSPLPPKAVIFSIRTLTDGHQFVPLFWLFLLQQLDFKNFLASCYSTAERHLLRNPKIIMFPEGIKYVLWNPGPFIECGEHDFHGKLILSWWWWGPLCQNKRCRMRSVTAQNKDTELCTKARMLQSWMCLGIKFQKIKKSCFIRQFRFITLSPCTHYARNVPLYLDTISNE